MSIAKSGRVSGPPAPNIHLGSAFDDLASVCLTPSDRSGDLTEQTREALHNIEEQLSRLGSSKAEVLIAQVWLAEVEEFPGFREAWNAWIDPDAPPALSVVQAAASRRDCLVEIRVYAARQG